MNNESLHPTGFFFLFDGSQDRLTSPSVARAAYKSLTKGCYSRRAMWHLVGLSSPEPEPEPQNSAADEPLFILWNAGI